MSISRREFIRLLGLASAAGLLPRHLRATQPDNLDLYGATKFGNLTLLHITDTHAQLNPVYYREPNVNLGIDSATGQPPHLVGTQFLQHYKIAPDSIQAHAFTHLDFPNAATRYGTVGGFAHLKTLIDLLRNEREWKIACC